MSWAFPWPGAEIPLLYACNVSSSELPIDAVLCYFSEGVLLNAWLRTLSVLWGCRPKVAQIPFMMPASEENDIKAPQGILKVQVWYETLMLNQSTLCIIVQVIFQKDMLASCSDHHLW